jgi:hypothetical protein
LCELVTGVAALSPGHLRLQVVPVSQLTLQPGAVQVTAQVAPAVHETLPLGPTLTVQLEAVQVKLPLPEAVRSQVLPPPHSALHELPQVPVQVFLSLHASEHELPLASQPVAVLPVQSQVAPEAQVQALPVQAQSPPGQVAVDFEPQAASKNVRTRARRMRAPGSVGGNAKEHCKHGWVR